MSFSIDLMHLGHSAGSGAGYTVSYSQLDDGRLPRVWHAADDYNTRADWMAGTFSTLPNLSGLDRFVKALCPGDVVYIGAMDGHLVIRIDTAVYEPLTLAHEVTFTRLLDAPYSL